MKNRVVTISREFGSGGRTIGRKLAEELGIPCYDAELIQQLARESGFSEDYIRDAGEYAPGGYLSEPSPSPMRMCSGSCNTRSSQTWRRKGPASLWVAAPTTSSGTRRTA